MPWDQGPGLRCPGALVPGFPSKCETKHTFSCCTNRRNSQELTSHDSNTRKTSLSDVPPPDQDVNILGDV